MQVRRAHPPVDGGRRGASRRDLVVLGAVPAAVTAVVFVPQLATDPTFAPALSLLWLAVLLSAAPVVAAVLGRRLTAPLDRLQTWLVALPQLFVTVLLVRVDTWLEVRSGYLAPGSGELAMSYGLGLVLSLVIGWLLTCLVASAVHLAGRRGTRVGP